MNMNALPLIDFLPGTESPVLAFTIAQIFQPCMGAAWRLMRATMSISTMGVIAVTGLQIYSSGIQLPTSFG
jgi:hypothetical protein